MSSRSDAVLAAIRRELASRRAYLDAAPDVVEITVTLKLQAGTTWVRGVVWQEERRQASPPASQGRHPTVLP